MYFYRIRAFNESCFSSYLNGNVTTLLGNDECSGAIALTVSTSCSYTTYSNSGATASTGVTAPGCANYLGGDVWFSAVVPATGVLTVDLQSGVITDSGMAFYSGTCGSLTLLECDDDDSTNGLMSNISMAGLTPGQTIYIRVWEYGNDNNGTFGICATTTLPPNDPCTSISNIATCGSANSVTIPAGAGGYSPSSCGWSTPGVERIYTFTPESTGNFTITQTSSFGFIDYQFKPVSLGCSSSGWTCIDDLSGAGTSPSFTLIAGTQYYILLDPEVSTGGSVNFTINCPTPPLTNDEPCNAIALTVNTTCNYSTYTNSGAAASAGIPDPGCASYSGGDVWFSAVVPAAGVLTVDLQSGVMTDSGMAFYSGACGSLNLLECDDDDSNNGAMSSISMTGLTPGQTIYIRVWEYGNNNN
ncbi:MAG: hypothetical protein ACOVOV_12205, partial [Dolichospermum sp.]